MDYSICIPTFRRPRMLRELLESIARQENFDFACCQVVVVDNDPDRSAATVLAERFPFALLSDSLPRPSIAAVRNRCVELAQGKTILFIDDDQLLPPRWLAQFTAAFAKEPATLGGMVSALLPRWEAPVGWPWRRAKIYGRRRFATGTRLGLGHIRTGGVLVRKEVFACAQPPFESRLDGTGGEDTAFFTRARAAGWEFAAFDDNPILERYTPDRCRPAFVVRANLKIGMARGTRERLFGKAGWRLPTALGFLVRALAAFGASLPLLLLAPVVGLWGCEYALRKWGAFRACLGASGAFYGSTGSRAR